jgi:hypothetical protein
MQPYALSEIGTPTVKITCAHCPRRGRYDRDRLIDKYGADMTGPDLLNTLSADCTHHPPLSTLRVCGARFEDPIDESKHRFWGMR